jgi:hypothetical protein
MEVFHLGVPISQLAANASKATIRMSVPDAGTMQTIWTVWAALASAASIATAVLICAVCASPQARASAFNVYLVAMLLPDLFFSVGLIMTCLASIPAGTFASYGWCSFQCFYMVFDSVASICMTAVVAGEVYKLLRATHSMRPYSPPSHREVLLRCLVVYLW